MSFTVCLYIECIVHCMLFTSCCKLVPQKPYSIIYLFSVHTVQSCHYLTGCNEVKPSLWQDLTILYIYFHTFLKIWLFLLWNCNVGMTLTTFELSCIDLFLGWFTLGEGGIYADVFQYEFKGILHTKQKTNFLSCLFFCDGCIFPEQLKGIDTSGYLKKKKNG